MCMTGNVNGLCGRRAPSRTDAPFLRGGIRKEIARAFAAKHAPVEAQVSLAADLLQIEVARGALAAAVGRSRLASQRVGLGERCDVRVAVQLAQDDADAVPFDHLVNVADARVADDGQPRSE